MGQIIILKVLINNKFQSDNGLTDKIEPLLVLLNRTINPQSGLNDYHSIRILMCDSYTTTQNHFLLASTELKI